MFLIMFLNENNEYFVFGFIALVFLICLFVILKIDNKNEIALSEETIMFSDFFSVIGNEYIKPLDKYTENKIINTVIANYETFNVLRFKVMALDSFIILLNAWTNGDYEMFRSFTTDNAYKFSKIIIENERNQKIVNHFSDLKIENIEICNYFSDNTHDYIDVNVHYSALAYSINSVTYDLISGNDRGTSSFVINISFLLAKSCRDDERSFILPKNICSRCNQILDINESGHCVSCDLSIREGYSHWIIDKFSINVDTAR
ncbi:MAG: TIM44-like domain-containing protein [Lachnospirales bacterium]